MTQGYRAQHRGLGLQPLTCLQPTPGIRVGTHWCPVKEVRGSPWGCSGCHALWLQGHAATCTHDGHGSMASLPPTPALTLRPLTLSPSALHPDPSTAVQGPAGLFLLVPTATPWPHPRALRSPAPTEGVWAALRLWLLSEKLSQTVTRESPGEPRSSVYLGKHQRTKSGSHTGARLAL